MELGLIPRRLLAVVPIAALGVTGLLAAPGGTGTSSGQTDRTASIGAGEYYVNYVEPQVEPQSDGREVKGRGGIFRPAADQAEEFDQKFSQGNPVTAEELAGLEAKAVRTGENPRQLKQAPSTQQAKLLTILVEFNESANDDFTGTMVPNTVFEDRTCVPGTVQKGPLHNTIPDPATASHPDNNSMWVPDFSPEHFNRMLYTEEGITERVREDLTGPDGKPGIDISGYTMRNMYEEMSRGAYTVSGAATPWVEVPHSEAWYGASRCFQDANGQWVAGAPQDMQGHPDNPRGAGQLALDAVDALAAADPAFPWSDYDIEDQGDRDGDGNFFEPDGVVDHLVLVHAGEDKSGGGGAQGVYSIWAHSSAVPGGQQIPGTDLVVSNYIVQPEDSGVGVFAHEYGHDLGLPDLYDTSGAADSDVDFWDLMASGSHTGPVFQGIPAHMGLWDKWVLGWVDPVVLDPGDRPRSVQLGQTARTPVGTQDGIRINLPDKVTTLAEPHSGQNMWYSENDQDWADVRLTRQVAVPAGSDVRFWMWNNYVIEADWDFGFVEVSTDGGATWAEQKVFDASGALASTGDDYPDPNGRMADYGNKKYGLTGDSHGWAQHFVDLTPFAGQTVQLRLRHATDAGFLERGWFADDFSVTSDGSTVWSDDVEGGAAGWTPATGSFTDTSGAGWGIDSGTEVQEHYYLAEWRNFSGFDEGLKYAYDTNYSRDAWQVSRVPYNAPGMLVWYRDTTYGNVNHVTANSTALPSFGAKGGLLIADANFDPLRRQGVAADKDPSTLNNLPSRPQSSNAAFTLHPTYPFTECLEAPGEPFSEYCTDFASLPGLRTYTDASGWAPGVEVRGESLFARDVDGSVVIPARDGQAYSTRVVDQDGNPRTDLYGTDLGFTTLGTGNPADEDKAYGVSLRLMGASASNSFATVFVTPPAAR